jgi:hypothetical protein
MAIIKKYIEFINESTTIDNDQLSFLKFKKQAIINWFSENKIDNCSLVDIQITNIGHNLERSLIINFNDNEFYYKIILSVSQNDYYKINNDNDIEAIKSKEKINPNDKFNKVMIKAGKYNMEYDQNMTPLGGNIITERNTEIELNPNEFNSDYINVIIKDLEPYRGDEEESPEEFLQQGQNQEQEQGQIQVQQKEQGQKEF